VTGQNPPYGAGINFWLKAESKDSAKIEILDASNKVVRTLNAASKPGVNRVMWNLLGEQTKEAKVRTSPQHAPQIVVGPEGRTAPAVGRYAILLPPGTYTVRLTAAGRTETQPLEIRKDPATIGTIEDLRAQIAMASDIHTDVNSAVDMINNLELVRGQIATLKSFLASDTTAKDVREAADSLDKKLVAVEGKLHQMKVTGRGQDMIRYPAQTTEQLIYLGGSVQWSDAAPTTQHREVQTILKTQLAAIKAEMDRVLAEDLARFQAMLRDRKMQGIISMDP
jgi:hypothetical protein